MTETKESVSAERDQLRRDNEALQRQLDEARRAAAAPPSATSTGYPNPPAKRPSFGLSAGEANDLALYGATRDAFTGGLLLADDHGIEPATQEARDRQDHARARRDAGEGGRDPGREHREQGGREQRERPTVTAAAVRPRPAAG